MLSIEAGSRVFDRTLALDGVTLHAAAGQTTVLIGPSGCGKSTILRLFLGLITPSQGRVLFDGQEVTPQSSRGLRRRMGYVIQGGGLFPHLTARENITLMSRRCNWSEGRQDKRLKELAELTHTELGLLERYPLQLSGGQRQRVALMRALMLDPEVLLLDEPLGALDPMVRSDLQRELVTLFAELHKTVVFVTHDLNEAAFLGDQIVLLKDGKLVASGSFEDLRHSHDEFVMRFIDAQTGALSR